MLESIKGEHSCGNFFLLAKTMLEKKHGQGQTKERCIVAEVVDCESQNIMQVVTQ